MRRYVVVVLGLLCGLTMVYAGDDAATAPAIPSTPRPRSGQAGSGPSTQPADNAQIGRLIKQLGSDKFAQRDAAQQALVKFGQPAVQSLRAAAGSDDTEVRARVRMILMSIATNDVQEVGVKELGKVPQPFRDTHLFISPNGEHVAYIRRRGGKEILVCDGKEGPAWDSILYVGSYSRDSKRLSYQAKKDGKAFNVLVGEEGKAVPAIGTGLAACSADGKRTAYCLKTEQGSRIVCDGKEGPCYASISSWTFSPDGKRLVYTAGDGKGSKFVVLDGRQLTSYEAIGAVAFSPDGKRLAYAARRDGKGVVVCDGKEGICYPEVFYPIFSPDGKGLAYWTRSDRSASPRNYSVVWNEKEIAQPGGEPRLVFSPDGRELACGTYANGEIYRFGQKVQRLAAGNDHASKPVFSPDSRHLAYAVGKDMSWWVCVDGRSIPGRYDPENVVFWDSVRGGGSSMILDSPGFSADGQHVFHKGFRGKPGNLPPGNREHFIVCDGVKGPSHEGLWIPEDFRNNAKRLRYVVLDGECLRLMETAWPEAMTWQDAVQQDNSSAGPTTASAPATRSTSSGQAQPADIGTWVIQAIQQVQRRCKDDKALQGLAQGKFQQGGLWADTDGWWDDLPSKTPPFHHRGYGRLGIQLVPAEAARELMPWMPPPGCYTGRTVFGLATTGKVVLVSTVSSDPKVHERLATFVLEELRAAGIDAKTGDRMDSAGTPAVSKPAPQTATAEAPAVPALDPDTLMGLLGQPSDCEVVKILQKKHGFKMTGDKTLGCISGKDEAFLLIVKQMPGGQRGGIYGLVLSIRRPPGSRFANYSGGLPFGLTREDTPDQAIKKLGQPRAAWSSGRQSSLLYFLKPGSRTSLLIRFYDGKMEQVTIELRPDEPRGSPASAPALPPGLPPAPKQ